MKNFSVSIDKTFQAMLIIFFVGFAVIGPAFAKIGIPFSSIGIGSNLEAKFFLMEILICLTAGIAVFDIFRRGRFLPEEGWGGWLAILILIFGAISAVRILISVGESPMLVLRNSAFCWYLCFPVLLFFTSIKASQIDFCVRSGLILCFAYFCVRAGWLLVDGFRLGFQRSWIPEYGAGFILFLSLTSERLFASSSALFFLGAGIGFSLSEKIQRTTAVTLFLSLIFTALVIRRCGYSWNKLSRLLILALAIPVGLALFSYRSQWGNPTSGFELSLDSTPFTNADPGQTTAEGFREYMWRDAVSLIRENPWAGIGFVRQVVFRVFMGSDKFIPNDGGYEREGAPPISGPHNSYLNAAARLGIPMGLLLALIHFVAIFVLFRAQYWPSFFCMLGQIVYATFNIGLEGPVRSFGLLLCLAVALKSFKKAWSKPFNNPDTIFLTAGIA